MCPEFTQLPLVPQEEWRPVVGYEGIYEASSLGRVRLIAKRKGHPPGIVLKPSLHWHGYRLVSLSKPGQRQTLYLHRVVAAAFLGPCPEGYEVNHKDGDKTNCAAGNLEYLTPSDNQRHAIAHGFKPVARGALHHAAKLTPADIAAIRASPETLKTLAARYGVSISAVSRARRGDTWGAREDTARADEHRAVETGGTRLPD